jgi:hypothetical protein
MGHGYHLTDAVPVPLRILGHVYGTVYGRTVSVQTRHSTAVYGRCTAVSQIQVSTSRSQIAQRGFFLVA